MPTNGHIISIYSSKGGVGKSFIAANLAVDLCLDTRGKILLLDFGQPFSNSVEYFLKLKDTKRMDHLLSMADNLNPAMLRGFSTPHGSGIFTMKLADSLHPAGDNLCTPQRVGQVLDCLQSVYNFVIIDLGIKFGDVAETVCDKSSIILLPATPEPLTLVQTGNDLLLLRSRNFPKNGSM
ncbi:MAG: AAA family ATPase [Desulfobacterales bacterium]